MISKKYTKNSPSLYKSSFNNKKYIYTNIQLVYNKHENPIMNKKTFVQVLENFLSK